MQNNKLTYGLTFVIIIILVISITQIDFLNNKIDSLENTTSQFENLVEEKDKKVDTLTEEIKTLHNNILQIQIELNNTKDNNIFLNDQLKETNETVNNLRKDLIILEEAIEIIGRGEIETVLIKYSETRVQLEELQREYNKLLDKYNNLLEQVE
jgi:chromosome segregation ATPase